MDQIVARLDDRFRLLAGGSRAALPRHQTLRATMDWSFNLLSERERAVLRRLSVFAGGWTLEAAEAVCSDQVVEASAILDVLIQLVDKSLVLAETKDGGARYRVLETMYAWEKGDLRLVREGVFRREAGFLYLEQRLGADAAVTIIPHDRARADPRDARRPRVPRPPARARDSWG